MKIDLFLSRMTKMNAYDNDGQQLSPRHTYKVKKWILQLVHEA